MPQIDPDSPVPLYHQIAEAIRERMVKGELKSGDALDPMRLAAEQWGVNLHTVRHAYAALAREGLLEMRSARGTRVTAEAAQLTHPAQESTEEFVDRVAREAEQQYGLSVAQFSALLTGTSRESRPRVAVIECSPWQCQAHAEELQEAWQVQAEAWPLSREGEPQGDTWVSTYFHYNDIRRRWPHLLGRMNFVTVHIDEQVLASLGDMTTAYVLERDEPTALAVAADLRAALRDDIDLKVLVHEDPERALAEHRDSRVLCSPRVWSTLGENHKRNANCTVLNYRFDASELKQLAQDLAWRPQLKTVRNK